MSYLDICYFFYPPHFLFGLVPKFMAMAWVVEQRRQCPTLWLLPLISLPLLCLVRRGVTDVDVVFFEFQEGPIYTGGQSVSNCNMIKALAKFAN